MQRSPIAWSQPDARGTSARRAVAHVGPVEVGAVEFDPSNRLWLWSSPLAEDSWGWAPSEEGARRALELWLRGWVEPFRPFFEE